MKATRLPSGVQPLISCPYRHLSNKMINSFGEPSCRNHGHKMSQLITFHIVLHWMQCSFYYLIPVCMRRFLIEKIEYFYPVIFKLSYLFLLSNEGIHFWQRPNLPR